MGDAGLKAYVLLTPVVLDLGDHPESDRLQDPWLLKNRKATGGDLWPFCIGWSKYTTNSQCPPYRPKSPKIRGENRHEILGRGNLSMQTGVAKGLQELGQAPFMAPCPFAAPSNARRAGFWKLRFVKIWRLFRL